ncbi:unnamed protein product [Phytophthora lilii]|uniref:Unnamed protein product n=1 Tax=Phytophthora lilii TaxID=2077276 RepID=A0A9W6WM93_9STRA|nr:unnamed protein product [Phytophthora lilii]
MGAAVSSLNANTHVAISASPTVQGAGSSFDVEIDDSAKVSKLKKAIKEEKMYQFPADELQLFLAKTEKGAWLSSLTEDVKKLEKGEKTALVESLTQEDKELQGEDPISEYLEGMDAPKVKQIHVLVVVPNQHGTLNEMSAATTPLTAEQVEMAMNKVLRERDEKASAYSFSDLNTAMEERIVKKMRLAANVPDVKEPKDESVRDCYPLSLLTDLNNHRHFSWFSDERVLTQITLQYPKNAFRFIEAAVLRRTESAPLLPSFIPGPFKTIKVDDFLPQPDDARAEEMMERYELMADVVEPEFLMARRMEYVQHVVQSMPMYAHMYA